MTGFGDARAENERLSIAVEVRAVNNRYLKISTKCPDAYAALEGEVEKAVRALIARGTVAVSVRVASIGPGLCYQLNQEVLESYWRQLQNLAEVIHVAAPTDLGSLLDLPGAVSEDEAPLADAKLDWPLIRGALEESLQKLNEFRITEGRSMEQDLQANCGLIASQLNQIAEMAPQVVRDYRDRLHERVRVLLQGSEAKVDSSDLMREVSIFSDRCDINEEIARLRSHLDQFDAFLKQSSSMGRKLEFLSQEIFREVNTIGSKANNVSIAHCVVEMKAAVERIREILQNVE